MRPFPLYPGQKYLNIRVHASTDRLIAFRATIGDKVSWNFRPTLRFFTLYWLQKRKSSSSSPTPSMQCCAAVGATHRKQQTPQLWMEGTGDWHHQLNIAKFCQILSTEVAHNKLCLWFFLFLKDITWAWGDTKFLFKHRNIFHEWAEWTTEIFLTRAEKFRILKRPCNFPFKI